MGNTQYYIQEGQVVKFTKDTKPNGLFNLNKFFKKLADWFHIAYVDNCCTADETSLPIRYNKTAGKLQYYNDTNDTWTNLTTF